MTFPSVDLTEAALREIAIVRAWLPWLPWCGVKASTTAAKWFHSHDVEERAHYILIPSDGLSLDYAAFRRIVRHELGHLLVYWLGQRQQGFDVIKALGIDPAHPQRGEIAAEVFARWLGEAPSYPDLEPLSRVTPERRAFLENSGNLPSMLEEQVSLDLAIGKFWAGLNERGDNALLTVRDLKAWAGNLQRYIELRVLRFMGLVD